MSEHDKLKIHVQISGFRIPMNINRKDEEVYRKAERLVVKYLDEYQRVYNHRASEELLILVAFRLAVAPSKQELDRDLVPLAEKIKNLDEELKTLLAV